MKTTFVATVLNEEETIEKLLDSLVKQSRRPDEIIIADGGSSDLTVRKMESFKKSHPTIMIRIIVVKGANRAKGRNEAIKKAGGEIIAISDAGCELDGNWLENITQPFRNPSVEVVAGYYGAKPKSIFGRCIVPYVLVMPDRINPQDFLPSSRSMAIRKNVWEKFSGFPEEFSDNEDYVFANRLKRGGAKTLFSHTAIVYWFPPTNLRDFFVMICRFAKGDAQAGLRCLTTTTVFGRYLIGIGLFLYLPLTSFFIFLLAYYLWCIKKSYHYINHWQALFILPAVQVTSDLAVIVGTLLGVLWKK